MLGERGLSWVSQVSYKLKFDKNNQIWPSQKMVNSPFRIQPSDPNQFLIKQRQMNVPLYFNSKCFNSKVGRQILIFHNLKRVKDG